MRSPAELLAEANANLDTLGTVVLNGATVAPDFLMRATIAMRDRLQRHQPCAGQPGVCGYTHPSGPVCHICDEPWPCVEICADFAVIGPDLSGADEVTA